YTPHRLCTMAAGEVQAYLAGQASWQEELKQGKMFGVLVVQTPDNQTGYLAAFSGILAGNNQHAFFVPPVYDLLQPQGFFQMEEKQISAINARIRDMEEDVEHQNLIRKIETETTQAKQELWQARKAYKEAKATREMRRRTENPGEEELAAMIRESQFQKAELKRMEKAWKEKTAPLQAEADAFSIRIEELKAERKKRSAALQQRLFGQFRMMNARGEKMDLCQIFEQTAQKVPPAGAGECAAPKLLQYAYLHGLKPIAMAEFWWGESPKTEIRHHGCYYPACKGKCEPILKHMLQGLDVEENPLLEDRHRHTPLEIVYEDPHLAVVCKPAGMLSVPGKGETDSVARRMKARYP
ncbi:MAG: RNA pseudouridine synthase, partial [Phocaeicola sp.]|nr:RNA pseudouridine synthase [Phocaeicola sp.]